MYDKRGHYNVTINKHIIYLTESLEFATRVSIKSDSCCGSNCLDLCLLAKHERNKTLSVCPIIRFKPIESESKEANLRP